MLVASGVALLYIRFQVMGSNLPVFTNFDNPASYEDAPVKQLTWSYLVAVNLWLLLAPSQLCCDWTMKTVPLVTTLSDLRNVATLGVATLLLGLGLAAIKKSPVSRRERNLLTLALSLLALPFLPASNLFFPVGFVVAERVLYLPSMGFCLLVAYGLDKLYNATSSHHQVMVKAAFAFLIAIHSAKTFLRNYDWKDELSIFKSGNYIFLKRTFIHN